MYRCQVTCGDLERGHSVWSCANAQDRGASVRYRFGWLVASTLLMMAGDTDFMAGLQHMEIDITENAVWQTDESTNGERWLTDEDVNIMMESDDEFNFEPSVEQEGDRRHPIIKRTMKGVLLGRLQVVHCRFV